MYSSLSGLCVRLILAVLSFQVIINTISLKVKEITIREYFNYTYEQIKILSSNWVSNVMNIRFCLSKLSKSHWTEVYTDVNNVCVCVCMFYPLILLNGIE